MKPAKGWKKVSLAGALKNEAVNDQFAVLFRERKFARLPNLVEVHVNRKNRARWVFANTLCESIEYPLLIFADREEKGESSPVSTFSIFAREDELGKTTLLLQEVEPPPESKPLSFVGYTKREGTGPEKKRIMADKNEPGSTKHSMSVDVAENRVYVDKWTVQAMNECEIGIERNPDVPQIVSHFMLQPTFDKKGKEARSDAFAATLEFNIYLKQMEKDEKTMDVEK